MIRLFSTYMVRPQTELSDQLWSFTPLSGPTRPVLVPCCWESLPGLRSYRGEGLFARRFTGGGNLRLEFKGVSHTATVFLDGHRIACHYNAYTPFSVVVPDVPCGEHWLEVLVDNRFSPNSVLHIPNDYMTYGGINRPVVLETVGSCFLQWVHYTPIQKDGRWQCQVRAFVRGVTAGAPAAIRIELGGHILDLGTAQPEPGKVVIATGCLDFAAEEIEPWQPEHPTLYTATATLWQEGTVMDDLIDRVGFREIRTEHGRILLNGQPLRIKGVCRHEDWEGSGCALTLAQMQQDLNLLRDLGGNSVRTTHYPNDERFLDLCDAQGILVWEENHARGLVEADMRNPNFERQCEAVNEEMVQNHYNHPCIYIWGILNECASETEYGRGCYQKQLAQLRALDQSRPLSFATCRFHHDGQGRDFQLDDICMDLPDVASFNIYPQWYFDCNIAEFLSQLHHALEQSPAAGKPLIISEVGAGGIYGCHANAEEKWTEEYQAAALTQQLTAVLQDPDCTGVYIWQYADTRVSREWFASRPRSYNNKGIVDEYRRAKLAYAQVKRIFHEQ